MPRPATMTAAISPLAPKHIPDLPPIAGVRIATAAAGIRYSGRTDVLLALFDEGTTAAGVFTRSKCPSAPVEWCRARIKSGKARALLVNAGNANAFTGKNGRTAVRLTAALAAKAAGCRRDEVFLASTGVIGEPLDVGKFAAVMDGLTASAAPGLHAMLKDCVADTFNAITVDGDTSTSDTLMLFATGKRGAPHIARAADPRLHSFKSALRQVIGRLAELVVRDGEGARKLVEVTVEGAVSRASARRIALSIANSPLVKTAIAGEDANWGRVVMAVGKAGEPADRDKLSIWFGDVRVAHRGARDPHYDEAQVAAIMRKPEIAIKVALGLGKGRDRVLTCDLTRDYVAINGDYRS